MKNLKISTKLTLAFMLVNAIFVLSIALLLMSYMMSNERLNNMNQVAVAPQIVIGTIHDTILNERAALMEMALYAPESPQYEAAEKAFGTQRQEIANAMERYIEVSLDDAGIAIAKELQTYYNTEYKAAADQLRALAAQGDRAAFTEQFTQTESIMDTMDEKIESAESLVGDRIAYFIGDAEFGLIRLIIISGVVILFIIAIMVFIIRYMHNAISKKIERLTEAANVMSSGGLDIQLETDSADEIGQLTDSFLSVAHSVNLQAQALSAIAEGDLTVEIATRSDRDTMNIAIQKMIGSLNYMFSQINESTEHVSSGARQIAGGAQSLAKGVTEQASAVEEISQSIAGVTKTTQDNSSLAKQVADLMDNVNGSSSVGSEQMHKMAMAVRDINSASQAISKVIKTIDDIAFQTNILALNAAVEAAHAGAQGAGFAVVADEVRSLASKSAEAAKETSALIEDSIQKAVLGVQIAEEAVKSFDLIAKGIEQSTGLLNDIARLSEQQNNAVHLINRNIDQVAQVVHQNSATAQESAASSQELSSQSEILQSLIAQFKIDSSTQIASEPRMRALPQQSSSGMGKY